MFDFTTGNKQQAPVVAEAALTFESFNFDSSDFTALITEADSHIYGKIAQFRSLMSEVLTESAGVLTEDAEAVMDTANNSVGKKIVAALVKVKNWLIKTAQAILLRVQTAVVTNKKVIDKLKPEVAKNEAAWKDLKGEMYTYKLDAVKLENLVGKWEAVYKTALYDISGTYSEAKDEQVKKVNELSHDDIAGAVLRLVFPPAAAMEGKSRGTEISKALRGGGERKTVPFSMEYFSVIENFASVKEPIDKAFKSMTAEVDNLIKQIQANVKDVKKSADDKKAAAGAVAFYNARRKVLTAALDTAVFVNNLKLQAAVQQVNEAKSFCVQASRMKPKQEGAVVEPFTPYLDLSDEDDDTGLSSVDLLGESVTEELGW